jgi:hypothetical protein
MKTLTASEAAKAVVRRNTVEVQGKGNFNVFEELFADDFVDHTPQPNMTPDKAGLPQTLPLYSRRIPGLSCADPFSNSLPTMEFSSVERDPKASMQETLNRDN